MSQQPFQTWQGQLWNHQQQEESVQQQQQHQQRYRILLTYPASFTTYQQPTQQEYIDGSNQYLLYQDFLTNSQNELQAGQLPQQYQSSLNLSQLPTDSFTFDGLATYPISPLTNQQQSQTDIYEQLGTASIQQQNDAPSTRQNVPMYRQQRQRQWLSQYPYSRQHEVQTPNELFTPMQSEHQFDRQNSVQDNAWSFPIEPSEYAQLQVCIFRFTVR